jgi:hypothetical protein
VETLVSVEIVPAAGTLGGTLGDLCHHEDKAEDGLSDCETVLACPVYDSDGSTFDDDIDIAGESSG